MESDSSSSSDDEISAPLRSEKKKRRDGGLSETDSDDLSLESDGEEAVTFSFAKKRMMFENWEIINEKKAEKKYREKQKFQTKVALVDDEKMNKPQENVQSLRKNFEALTQQHQAQATIKSVKRAQSNDEIKVPKWRMKTALSNPIVMETHREHISEPIQNEILTENSENNIKQFEILTENSENNVKQLEVKESDINFNKRSVPGPVLNYEMLTEEEFPIHNNMSHTHEFNDNTSSKHFDYNQSHTLSEITANQNINQVSESSSSSSSDDEDEISNIPEVEPTKVDAETNYITDPDQNGLENNSEINNKYQNNTDQIEQYNQEANHIEFEQNHLEKPNRREYQYSNENEFRSYTEIDNNTDQIETDNRETNKTEFKKDQIIKPIDLDISEENDYNDEQIVELEENKEQNNVKETKKKGHKVKSSKKGDKLKASKGTKIESQGSPSNEWVRRNTSKQFDKSGHNFLGSRTKKVEMSNETQLTPWYAERKTLLIDEPHGTIPISSYSELPLEVRLRCQDEFKLSRVAMEENLVALFQITYHRMRKFFPSYKGVTKKRKWVPYITAEMQEFAERDLEEPPKPLKKTFKKLRYCAEGGFGRVYVATEKKTKNQFAVKILANETVRQKENNLSEICFLRLCAEHPNIVKHTQSYLVRVKSKKKNKGPEPEYEIWIVMEYLKGGTLEFAAKSRVLSEIHIAFIAREMLKALKFLHERKFVHRDLKSANVMLSISGEVKLIDFGLCVDIRDGPRYQMVGSPFWISPEMIQRQAHSYPTDIWSLGVCILELLLGEPPLKESSVLCMFTACTKGLAHYIPRKVSDACRNFVSNCLVIDQDQRATVSQLLKHPWVNQPNLGVGIDALLEKIFFGQAIKSFIL